MDDGEVVISNQEVFSSPNMEGDIPGGYSMDSFFDEILKDSHACTHTHTCNPPGPDYSHTHTCFHVHTKIVPASTEEEENDDTAESSDKKSSKKRPLGNREAVKKYREKKKARAASLEDEVTRLRAVNQQLVKRLQGQGALEAEVARLKCLLVDIRGRIEGEIGSFPYQKPSSGHGMMNNGAGQGMAKAYVVNPCNMQCDDQFYCLHEDVEGKCNGLGMNGQGFNSCDFENVQCFSGQNPGMGSKEHHHGESHGNSSGLSKRKGIKYVGGTRSSTAS